MTNEEDLFLREGDLDFRGWLKQRPSEKDPDFILRAELGVRYEYARHSERTKRLLVDQVVADGSIKKRCLLNSLERKQREWVWALRVMCPCLLENKPFQQIESHTIQAAINEMRFCSGWLTTKPNAKAARLSEIAPIPDVRISGRKILNKWKRLTEARNRSAENIEEKPDVWRQEFDAEIPEREISDDGSELIMFSLQLTGFTVVEIREAVIKELVRFYPKTHPSYRCPPFRRTAPLLLQPLPNGTEHIDSDGGGYRVLVRVNWPLIDPNQLTSLRKAVDRLIEQRRRGIKLTGRLRKRDQIASSADALLAWRCRKRERSVVDAIAEFQRQRINGSEHGIIEEGNYRHKLAEARQQFEKWYYLGAGDKMGVW
ncbi:hypothetical protein GC207_10455 [bacterium]|nr:hypothetical protein [bacterium]